MPALRNIRRERFAHYMIKTGVGAQAYLRAGYHPTTRNALDASASQLLRSPMVQSRIAELRQAMAHRHNVTIDTLIAELEDARTLALEARQPSAAVQASMSKARILGLIVDRKEHGQPGEFSNLHSVADVIEHARKQLGEDAAATLAGLLK